MAIMRKAYLFGAGAIGLAVAFGGAAHLYFATEDLTCQATSSPNEYVVKGTRTGDVMAKAVMTEDEEVHDRYGDASMLAENWKPYKASILAVRPDHGVCVLQMAETPTSTEGRELNMPLAQGVHPANL